MTAPTKELPSTEYSLKSISWHLKTIAEQLIKLNETIQNMPKNDSPF